MTSTAVCGYSGSDWERNSLGQDSCQMYAALEGLCDSSFTIGSVLPTDPAYAPPQNACGCNVVAYNLMAGCGWCQNNIYQSWWMTYAEWQGNCTTSTVTFSTTLPATLNTATLNLPAWATVIPDSTTWDPTQASIAAASATPSLTATTGTTNAINTPIATGGASSSNFFTFNTNTDTFFTGLHNGGDDDFVSTGNNAGKSAGIAIGVILGIYALAAIAIIAVYFARQKERKAWYGPMAQYYAAQRGGGAYPGQYYNPQAPYDPAKTPATTNSGNGTYGYQPPPPEATGYPGFEHQGLQAHNTGFSNNTAYTGYQPPASTAPSTNTAPYSIPSTGTPANGAPGYGANTASMYGAPPHGAPPHGPPPGAGMGYRGVAEV